VVVLLHNIRSSHNVGSIFRTADAAGVEKLYLCGITPGPHDKYGSINQKLAKVSLGAENNVSYEHCKSTSALMSRLKKDGYKILALEQHKKSINIFSARDGSAFGGKFKINKNKKYALVLGEETKGLPQSILKKSDKILEIPQIGKKESLNVSVAFGVAVFHLLY